MDLNVARVVDVFVTPEGRHIYGQFFTHLLYGIVGIKQFQFHQIAADTIRLLIQRDATFDAATAAKLADATAIIHKQASPLIQVRIEYVDDIPRTAAGKHIFTRSDVWAQRRGAQAAQILSARTTMMQRRSEAVETMSVNGKQTAACGPNAQRVMGALEATASTAVRAERCGDYRLIRRGDRVWKWMQRHLCALPMG
jgi:hypothetical protein